MENSKEMDFLPSPISGIQNYSPCNESQESQCIWNDALNFGSFKNIEMEDSNNKVTRIKMNFMANPKQRTINIMESGKKLLTALNKCKNRFKSKEKNN